MDKRTSDLRKHRLQQKRVVPVFLFFAVATIFYGLSFLVATAQDCEFFGSKLAFVIVPACAALGNQAAAAIPFLIACASFFMAIQAYRQYRNLTRRSTRTPRKRVAG